MACGGQAKQLQKCLKNLHTFTDGQVQMVDCDWSSLEYITFDVIPNDGLYRGSRFTFQINFPDGYPLRGPEVTCKTPIYHPNIDPNSEDSNVCVSLLGDWTASNTLEDLVMALLFLMYNPNTEDPLSEYVSSDIEKEEFEKIQNAIRQGENPLHDDDSYDEMDKNFFSKGQDEYPALLQEEWDVLAEAAKVHMAYTLEQDIWLEKMTEYEKQEAERLKQEEEDRRLQEEERQRQEEITRRRFEETKAKRQAFVDSLASREPQCVEKTMVNYAFGKPQLQRCKTVAMQNGQAELVGYNAPKLNAVNAWNNDSVASINEEEPMDCSDSSDCIAQSSCLVESSVFTAQNAWQPYCNTDLFTRPSLQRGLTC